MSSKTVESTLRCALVGAALSWAIAAHAQINDSIRGAPGDANNFIETPKGWKHPMTPWGEPDIRAQLDMMQASGIPLERCANSYRPNAPPCDPNKKWLTDAEYNAAMEAYRKRVDPTKQLIKENNITGAFRSGGRDLNIPQRQTNLIVDPPTGCCRR